MPKFQLVMEPLNSGIYIRYLQDNTVIIVTISQLSQASFQSLQQNLMLDFNIRDSTEDEKLWSSLEYKLKDIFQSVIVGSMIPGCQVRANIFVLMNDSNIQAALINAVFIALLKLGLPMRYTPYAVAQSAVNSKSGKANSLVYNISNSQQMQPIYGKYQGGQDIKQQLQQAQQYRKFLISALNQQIRSEFSSK